MEPQRRGRGKRPQDGPPPGTFRPALPGESQDVLYLYAVAARAVCAQPQVLDHVTQVLEAITGRLVAPERESALECGRMWQLFARVARLPKESLRQEAGRAFCRDLDALGQRLDLPPLDEWQELPAGLDAPGYGDVLPTPSPVPMDGRGGPLSLEVVQKSAHNFLLASAKGQVAAAEAAQLLAALGSTERLSLFERMVGSGLLARSDVNLLVRFLVKGDAPSSGDAMLIEVLERLGTYLAQSV